MHIYAVTKQEKAYLGQNLDRSSFRMSSALPSQSGNVQFLGRDDSMSDFEPRDLSPNQLFEPKSLPGDTKLLADKLIDSGNSQHRSINSSHNSDEEGNDPVSAQFEGLEKRFTEFKDPEMSLSKKAGVSMHMEGEEYSKKLTNAEAMRIQMLVTH